VIINRGMYGFIFAITLGTLAEISFHLLRSTSVGDVAVKDNA
jgi:hypothetical protein